MHEPGCVQRSLDQIFSSRKFHCSFRDCFQFANTLPCGLAYRAGGCEMCGIAGLVNWGDREILSRMTALLAHRGPDDSGIWEHLLPEKTWIGLGNRRLSILDLSSAGRMPMSNDDGTLTISYNGEVYNAAELRERLTAKGYRFRSRTDTEVVL